MFRRFKHYQEHVRKYNIEYTVAYGVGAYCSIYYITLKQVEDYSEKSYKASLFKVISMGFIMVGLWPAGISYIIARDNIRKRSKKKKD